MFDTLRTLHSLLSFLFLSLIRSSNVNEEGLWAFQIDGIDPYDIIWGIPEGGNIQGDEAINDGDTGEMKNLL